MTASMGLLHASGEQDSMGRLLGAALESFSDLGYHGTTTRNITSRAGLSPAALYIHYASKEDILFDIIKRTHTELLDLMKKTYKKDDAAGSRLKALVEVHVRFHAHRVTEARVANHELPALPPKRRRLILSHRQSIEEMIERTIEEGIESKEFLPVNVKAATFAILSLGIGVSRWFKPKGELSSEELAQIYSEFAHGMLTAGR